MNYCDQCGTQLNDTDKLCPTCGNPVTPALEDTKVPLCKNCGAPIEDGASFCANCGSRITAPARFGKRGLRKLSSRKNSADNKTYTDPKYGGRKVETEKNATLNAESDPTSVQNKASIYADNKMGKIRTVVKSKKIRTLAVLACVVIVLVIAIVSVCSYNSPASVAERYVKAYMYMDTATLNKLSAYDYYGFLVSWHNDDEEEFFEYFSDEYDEDITNWKQYEKYQKECQAEELSDYYGDYKITIETTKTKERTLKKIEEKYEYYISRYEERTDFDRDDISAVKEVTVKTKIVGEDNIERNSIAVYVVKIGMNWRVIYMDL